MVTKMSKFLPCLSLACALALVGVGGCDSPEGSASPSDGAGSGGAVHADLGITMLNLDDEDVSLISKTADDVHILAFWATWCVPCVGELAKMEPMYGRLKDRGLNIYAVSIDGPDTISRVPGFAAGEGWSFEVTYDPETELLARYNPKGDIPFYVVLDADGNNIKSHQGYVKGDVAKLEQFLDEKLPPAAE